MDHFFQKTVFLPIFDKFQEKTQFFCPLALGEMKCMLFSVKRRSKQKRLRKILFISVLFSVFKQYCFNRDRRFSYSFLINCSVSIDKTTNVFTRIDERKAVNSEETMIESVVTGDPNN